MTFLRAGRCFEGSVTQVFINLHAGFLLLNFKAGGNNSQEELSKPPPTHPGIKKNKSRWLENSILTISHFLIHQKNNTDDFNWNSEIFKNLF